MLNLWQLQQRQGLPLDLKIKLSKTRIEDWYEYYEGEVYFCFSGSNKSVVLLHLLRESYPNISVIFVSTGLKSDKVREFAKRQGNILCINPKNTFLYRLKRKLYRLIFFNKYSKIIKKETLIDYEKQTNKKSFTTFMAEENNRKIKKYLKSGCNSPLDKRPISKPLSFWTKEDIFNYVRIYKLKILT